MSRAPAASVLIYHLLDMIVFVCVWVFVCGRMCFMLGVIRVSPRVASIPGHVDPLDDVVRLLANCPHLQCHERYVVVVWE